MPARAGDPRLKVGARADRPIIGVDDVGSR
jgi:hypothetical protein